MLHTFPCGRHNEISHHYALSKLPRKGLEEISLQILLFLWQTHFSVSVPYTDSWTDDLQSVSQYSVHIKGSFNIAVTVAVNSSTDNDKIYNICTQFICSSVCVIIEVGENKV